jgi:hypothetical protein
VTERTDARGVWLRGEEQQPQKQVSPQDPPPTPMRPTPSWNNSTTVVQILRDSLVALGWTIVEVPSIPYGDGASDDLPRRPRDFGVGLWR